MRRIQSPACSCGFRGNSSRRAKGKYPVSDCDRIMRCKDSRHTMSWIKLRSIGNPGGHPKARTDVVLPYFRPSVQSRVNLFDHSNLKTLATFGLPRAGLHRIRILQAGTLHKRKAQSDIIRLLRVLGCVDPLQWILTNRAAFHNLRFLLCDQSSSPKFDTSRTRLSFVASGATVGNSEKLHPVAPELLNRPCTRDRI